MFLLQKKKNQAELQLCLELFSGCQLFMDIKSKTRIEYVC